MSAYGRDPTAMYTNLNMLTRREFLASSAAFATSLFGAPGESKTPSADLEKLGAAALRESKKYKVTYGDIRIVRLREQRIGLRLSPERGTGCCVVTPKPSSACARASCA